MFSGLKTSEKPPRHNALPIAALFQGAPDGQCARRSTKLHAAPISFCARPTAALRIFSAARSMFSGLKAGEKRRVTTRFLSPRSFMARQTANARVAARNRTAAPISFCARPTAALRIFSTARSMFSGLKASKKPPQRASQSPRSFRARQTANARVAARNCMPLRFRFARVPPRRFEYSAPLDRCFPARKPAKNRRTAPARRSRAEAERPQTRTIAAYCR